MPGSIGKPQAVPFGGEAYSGAYWPSCTVAPISCWPYGDRKDQFEGVVRW